jgi:hypothetical protein
MSRQQRVAAGIAGLLFFFPLGLVGCGGGPRPYPVKGTVLFDDGQPAKELAGGSVVFTSEALKRSASGDIDENGAYQLSTEGSNDGAYPGKYNVAVTGPQMGGESPAKKKRLFPAHYEDPEKSGIAVVVEAKSNDIPINIQRLKKATSR